jgi:hypothetical protein
VYPVTSIRCPSRILSSHLSGAFVCPPIMRMVLFGNLDCSLSPWAGALQQPKRCLLQEISHGARLIHILQTRHPSFPLVIRVNRRACRFGPYKSPRRPHIPPRASRVRCHPSQVSGLTFAHPCSLNLARPHPPPPARPIESPYAGPENYGDTLVAMATALQ